MNDASSHIKTPCMLVVCSCVQPAMNCKCFGLVYQYRYRRRIKWSLTMWIRHKFSVYSTLLQYESEMNKQRRCRTVGAQWYFGLWRIAIIITALSVRMCVPVETPN